MKSQSLSVALNSVLFVAASFLAAAPAAHADSAMLTIRATAANAALPIPATGLSYALNVDPASGNADQIQGIRIKGPMTAANGDAYSLARINAGFPMVPPYPNLLRIKGTGVSAASGGPVDMIYTGAGGARLTKHYVLQKTSSGWVAENERGQRVDSADVTVDVDQNTHAPFIASWR